MTSDCVFCVMSRGGLPASVVYRDAVCVVLLDIAPLVPGHLLVVPHAHAAGLSALAPEVGGHVFEVAQRMAGALRRSRIRCEGVNLLLSDGAVAGQEVPHVHLHVVPRHEGDGFGFLLPPAHDRQPTRSELELVAASIRDGIAAHQGLWLRPATPRDVPFLRELHHRAFRDVVLRQFRAWDEREQDGWFEKGLQEVTFSVVELRGNPIGALGTSDLIDCINLAELQLLPEWQNQGLGSELLRRLIQRAQAAGKPVRLRVLLQNRARRLYDRNGFAIITQTETHYVMERPVGASLGD